MIIKTLELCFSLRDYGLGKTLSAADGPGEDEGWSLQPTDGCIVATKGTRVLLLPWSAVRVAEGTKDASEAGGPMTPGTPRRRPSEAASGQA